MYRFTFTAILFLVIVLIPFSGNAQVFNRDLRIGSAGEDVKTLQLLLNENPLTRLSNAGPGSPGNETTYFGILTHGAVVRFQDLNASSVLTPLGIAKGTGFFGPSTRAYVAFLEGAKLGETTGKALLDDDTDTNIEIIDKPKQLKNLAIQNFNSYSEVVRENLEGTLPDQKIDEVLENIEEGVEDADYGMFFQETLVTDSVEDILEKMRKAGASPGSKTEGILREALEDPSPLSSLLMDWLLPETVYAQIPYGTLINVPYPCTCTGGTVWQMYLTGYIYGAPTEFSLDYVLGTQGFLSYTLPIARHQLGFFTPGGASCWQVATPCVVVPSYGTVNPIVGSSQI